MASRAVRLYVAIALLFGAAIAVVNPPFAAGDERGHFFRAFQIADFDLFPDREGDAVGGVLPKSVHAVATACVTARCERKATPLAPSAFLAQARAPLDSDRREFVDFTGVASYPPIPYLPQATAIAVGRLVGLPPFWMLYLVRFANLAAAISLVALALRIAPAPRWAPALAALTPGMVYLAASTSPDATLDALAFLCVALALRMRAERDAPALAAEGPLSAKTRGRLLVALAALIGLCKPAYFLVPAIAVIATPREPAARRRHLWKCAGLVLLCMTASVAWGLAANESTVMSRPVTRAEPLEQARWIASHPLGYAGTLSWELQHAAKRILVEAYASFGAHDGTLPEWLAAVAGATLLLVAFLDVDARVGLSWRARLAAFGAALGTASVVETILYLTQNDVGAHRIFGVLGRYVIPTIPLLLLVAYGRRPREAASAPRAARIAPWIAVAWSLFAAAFTVVTILRTYWIP